MRVINLIIISCNNNNMKKQESMKLQTCVLKVNIPCACDGCKQKIKTVLKKIHGVQKTSIDLKQAKVTVYGNADPVTLIEKLNKSGRHAQLWGPHKSVIFNNEDGDFKNPNKMMNGVFDLPLQLKGNGGKMGGGGGKRSKVSGGFFGGMIGKAFFGGGGKQKHGVSNPKSGKNGGGDEGKIKGGGLDKKGGEGKFSSDEENEFLEFRKPQNGGGRNGSRNNNHMGGNSMIPPQMGNYPMGGNPMMPPQMGNHPMGQMTYGGQGMDMVNPYNQQHYHRQQYMRSMMMMNNNQPKVSSMQPQMMYGQPPMGAPMNDSMMHMFSDENTDGCTIM